MRYYEIPPPIKDMSREEITVVLARATNEFHYFCEVILGFSDMNEEHYQLCNFLQHGRFRKKLVLTPRYTFKSCICTQGLSLWYVIRDPNIRILIYSDSSTKAQGFLKGIKAHLDGSYGNSRFREFFHNYCGNRMKGEWNDASITVKLRNKASVEPTIDTAGIDVSKVGMHYDVLLFDDIVSKVNVSTKVQMDKVFECYNESLALLKPKGLVVLTGTRWHFNDTYGRLLEKNKEIENFSVFVRDAESVDNSGKLIYDNIGLDREHLDSLKSSMGDYTYSALMRNWPIASDTALFPEDQFRFYGSLKESDEQLKTGKYEYLYCTLSLDPAGSGSGNDNTGGVVVGTDYQMRMYILEVVNRRMTVDQMIEWIFKMNRAYKIRQIGVETNLFHGLLEKEIYRRMKIEQAEIPMFNMFAIKQFRSSRGESKFIRISALQPIFQRGEILFPGTAINTLKKEIADLAYQMIQITPTHMPEPNDAVDALAFQVDLIRPGGVVKKEEIRKDTPAWLENQMIKKHNEMQKRLPKRLRKFWRASLS